MLRLSLDTRVLVCTRPTDMRKSFNGLYALTKTVLERDALSGHLLVFVNRKRDFVKALYFECGGLCLFGRFRFAITACVVRFAGSTAPCSLRLQAATRSRGATCRMPLSAANRITTQD